ncbi:hypothetical protein HMI01_07440 [Halolactibacillus miurensis]|uniref:Tetratricopeptide repeat-containing protein n=1 Tax=Halolactibacillus miurensis TaxID=306541 RepID=A0A1I6PLY2_9BACI|nr:MULTISPECIES: hypothetical protein [Halolactibacillus]GEM03756.1 hypothetical protein HMI01_07440 [Halolactibacillus miurensis]SFS41202.1 Tetratricopeptide repeat-containing protein [Halolactibacillus miurensis]
MKKICRFIIIIFLAIILLDSIQHHIMDNSTIEKITNYFEGKADSQYEGQVNDIISEMKYNKKLVGSTDGYIYTNINDTQKIEREISRSVTQMDKMLSDISLGGDEHSFELILYASMEEFKTKTKEIIPSNHKGLAVYDGLVIHISVENIEDVFSHEYVHFKTHSFCKENNLNFDNYPVWFIEGIAKLSEDYFGVETSPIFLGKVNKFKKMNNKMKYDTSYLQSHIALLKVIEISEDDSVRNIMLETQEKEFYKAFKDEVGISIEGIEEILTMQSKTNPIESGKNPNVRLKELEAYTNSYPGDSKALQLLGYYYWKTEDFHRSEETYNKSLEIDPNNIITMNQLAMMYEDTSRNEKAAKIREKIQQLKTISN